MNFNSAIDKLKDRNYAPYNRRFLDVYNYDDFNTKIVMNFYGWHPVHIVRKLDYYHEI